MGMTFRHVVVAIILGWIAMGVAASAFILR